MIAALVGLAVPAPAGAGMTAIQRELARAEAEFEALRGIQLVQALDPAQNARFEVRLGQLEEELRRLTGRIERLEFGQRSVEQRIDRLVGDLDQRLNALEGGEGPGRPLEAPQRSVEAPSAPTSAPTPLTGTPAARPAAPTTGAATAGVEPATPTGEQTLGQVPESALRQLPRADPAAIAPPPESTSLAPQQQYEAAMELLRAGDYAGAEGGLQLFLDLNPESSLASNAAYWQAETHYVRRNYGAAAAAFARNYRTYGRAAAKAPDNLLKLGMSLQGLGETDKACRSYDELARAFSSPPAHIQQALVRERARAGCA